VAVVLTAALVLAGHVQASTTTRAEIEVGPGRVARVVQAATRTLELRVAPNRAGAWNTLNLKVSTRGVPLRRARVTMAITMRSMPMGTQRVRLAETSGGRYAYSGPALVMPGLWDLEIVIAPRGGKRSRLLVRDRVGQ
jgi:hypothetical protein